MEKAVPEGLLVKVLFPMAQNSSWQVIFCPLSSFVLYQVG